MINSFPINQWNRCRDDRTAVERVREKIQGYLSEIPKNTEESARTDANPDVETVLVDSNQDGRDRDRPPSVKELADAERKMLAGKTLNSIGNSVRVPTLVVLCQRRSLATTDPQGPANKPTRMSKPKLINMLNGWVRHPLSYPLAPVSTNILASTRRDY
jgi:hypothetical protein